MTDTHKSKRVAILRPHHTMKYQSVDLHETVPDVPSSIHPGGPTVADALKAANMSANHVLQLRDGTILKGSDNLFGRVNDGEEVTAVPFEEIKGAQEYPKTMFNQHGHSFVASSALKEQEARANGYFDSTSEAKAAADPAAV